MLMGLGLLIDTVGKSALSIKLALVEFAPQYTNESIENPWICCILEEKTSLLCAIEYTYFLISGYMTVYTSLLNNSFRFLKFR